MRTLFFSLFLFLTFTGFSQSDSSSEWASELERILAQVNEPNPKKGNISREFCDYFNRLQKENPEATAELSSLAKEISAKYSYEYEVENGTATMGYFSAKNKSGFFITDQKPELKNKNEDDKTVTKSAAPTENKIPKIEEIYKVVEQMPLFPGCEELQGSNNEKAACSDEKLQAYIAETSLLPLSPKDKDRGKRSVTQFIVENDGTIDPNQINIVRKISEEIDAETLRIVKSFPNWVPGAQRGKPVRVQVTVAINYR